MVKNKRKNCVKTQIHLLIYLLTNIQIQSKLTTKINLMDHGIGLFDTWTHLAYEKPPDDPFGRFFWSLGVAGQLLISLIMFPAALGCFLMEEAVQSAGMGAYMLATSKDYFALSDYLQSYGNIIDVAEVATKSLATVSPVAGGAVLIYMDAARLSKKAFDHIAEVKIQEQILYDEEQRQKALEQTKYGILHIESSPTNAEIWIDDKQTNTLTPETFKKLEAGPHKILLKKYSATRKVWDTYTFTQTVIAGKKYEIRIRIPPGESTDITNPGDKDTTENPQLPDFIKAYATGDYTIDGDTFRTTQGETIRLLGIDAPEIDRPYGDLAKIFLASKTENKKVELSIPTIRPTDVYGRTLAVVRYRDENINVALISSGLARYLESKDTPLDPTRYIAAANLAKERKIGIWESLR